MKPAASKRALERIARAMPLDTPAPHPPQPYRAEEHISPDTKALQRAWMH